METPAQRLRNLGYFAGFMQAFGRAAPDVRAELYRDTRAYSGGVETDVQLYGQVTTLLGIATPPFGSA